MKTNKIIATNLKYLRDRERIGRTKLSKALKISVQKIDRMERGQCIDINTLVVYSAYFKIPIDDIVRKDLSETDKIIKTISEVEPKTISKTEKIVIPLSENEKKALACAKRAGFNCYYFNERKEQFDYCKDCFKAPFWDKKDIAQQLYNTKTEDIKIEGDEYLSCEHFQMNPFPNCYFRNIQKVSSPKCQRCVRDIARWGEQALGYKREL